MNDQEIIQTALFRLSESVKKDVVYWSRKYSETGVSIFWEWEIESRTKLKKIDDVMKNRGMNGTLGRMIRNED